MDNERIAGDCLVKMREMPDKSFDLILTDPPNAMTIKVSDTKTKVQATLADFALMDSYFGAITDEFRRLIKPDGFVYMFCNGMSYCAFYANLYKRFRVVREIVWDKKRSFMGRTWRRQHELIVYAHDISGLPTGDGSILSVDAIKMDKRRHAAEKNPELLARIIRKHSEGKEDFRVLDPFAGSHSCGEACKEVGVSYTGIEYAPVE